MEAVISADQRQRSLTQCWGRPRPSRSAARGRRCRTWRCRTGRQQRGQPRSAQHDLTREHDIRRSRHSTSKEAPESVRYQMLSRSPRIEISAAGATIDTTPDRAPRRRPGLSTLPKSNKEIRAATTATIAKVGRTTWSPPLRSTWPLIVHHTVPPRRSCSQAPTCRSDASAPR